MQKKKGKFKLAAIQVEPVWFGRDTSTANARKPIEEAGANTATRAATWGSMF